jgi:hypothetical protein
VVTVIDFMSAVGAGNSKFTHRRLTTEARGKVSDGLIPILTHAEKFHTGDHDILLSHGKLFDGLEDGIFCLASEGTTIVACEVFT